jgi:sugar phosphate isomerase/epimerase
MKIGVNFGSPDRWHMIRRNCYDYAEGYFAGIALASDAEFQKMCDVRNQTGINIEAVNGMFTPDFTLLGAEKTSLDAVRDFAEKGFYRAKMLGAEIAVLGSGKARAISADMEKARAEADFLALLELLGDIAQKNGMNLVIEPLRYAETNFINTVAESLSLCRLLSHKSVGTLVDFFHFHMNGESLDSLKDDGDTLMHAHIARPDADRRVPTEIDRAICKQWADTLREIGYDKRITLEAIFAEDFEADMQSASDIMNMFRE